MGPCCARGNLTSAGSTTYGYTGENLLASASGGATLAYDPAMRLYETAGGSTTRLAYDGESLIAEYDGSNALQRRYVHGAGIDEPLVRYEGSGTSTRHWYHADERGSVIALSDGSGNVTSINSYDEYGVPASGNAGRFQYTGQQWLADLGLYHYRARAYAPGQGRFLQTDPIGFDGGLNLYGYVDSDPVNAIDPSGMTNWRIGTGSRIPSRQDVGPGLCGSCSGFSSGGLGGNGMGGSIDSYKIMLWDNAAKLPLGNPWIEIRGTGMFAAFFLSSAAGSAADAEGRCRWSQLVCELWEDANVRPMMIRAWAESCANCSTAQKNERGFWTSQFGSYFRPHEMLYGRNGSQFLENVMTLRPASASIFFHTHPFTFAEGGSMGFSSRVDYPLINMNPWHSFVVFGYMNERGDLGFRSIDRRGR